MKHCCLLFKFRFQVFYTQLNLKSPFRRNQSFYFSNLFKHSILRNRILGHHREVMNLSSVVEVLDKVFPKHLSEKWDNVGLLIEPRKDLLVKTIFLTNDLTEDVLKEAIEAKSDLIISYHPPIFSGMKALVSRNWKDRIVMGCVANDIALYSPHTACDAVEGGVNDWLIKCFDLKDVRAIKSAERNVHQMIECIVHNTQDLEPLAELGMCIESVLPCEPETSRVVKIFVNKGSSDETVEKLKSFPGVLSAKITEYKTPNASPLTGMGRVGDLRHPLTLRACVDTVKKHVGVDRIRVVIGAGHTLDSDVRRVAACAGSGSSVLRGVSADLYVTGEMSHHEALDCQQSGTSVILCEHSNSERGYLATFLELRLVEELEDLVHVVCSVADRDPINIL